MSGAISCPGCLSSWNYTGGNQFVGGAPCTQEDICTIYTPGHIIIASQCVQYFTIGTKCYKKLYVNFT